MALKSLVLGKAGDRQPPCNLTAILLKQKLIAQTFQVRNIRVWDYSTKAGFSTRSSTELLATDLAGSIDSGSVDRLTFAEAALFSGVPSMLYARPG